jgi:hypothetical protein
MEYVLIVSWFLGGHAISSYQVPFATRQACDIALGDLRADARRLGAPEDTVRTMPPTPGSDRITAPPPAVPSSTPQLSAICAHQR